MSRCLSWSGFHVWKIKSYWDRKGLYVPCAHCDARKYIVQHPLKPEPKGDDTPIRK